MDQDLVGQIRSQRSLPTLPPVALEVVRLCGRDDVPLEEIGRAVMRDPALTSRLLRMANAPAFGSPRQVASVTHAVSILGLGTIRVVALASALIDNVELKRIPGFDYAAFWRDSVAAALASRSFSELGPTPRPDEAFLVGLLQDLGVYGLADALNERYVAILRHANEQGIELVAVEEERLNTTHADVSAALLESWGFPELIVESVRRHGRPVALLPPPTPADAIASATHLGELAAMTFRRPTAAVLANLTRKAKARLDLDEGAVGDVLLFVHRNVEETSKALNLSVGTAEELRAIRRQIEELLHVSAGPAPSSPPSPGTAPEPRTGEFAEMAARVDATTGVLTQGAVERELLRSLEESTRAGVGLAAIVFGVGTSDRRNGATTREPLLRAVSHVLKVSLPPAATIGRSTGDTFLLVLTDVDAETAESLADRVVRNAGAMAAGAEKDGVRVTLNAGISWVDPHAPRAAVEVLREAHHAFDWARRAGSNRVVLSRPRRADAEGESDAGAEAPAGA